MTFKELLTELRRVNDLVAWAQSETGEKQEALWRKSEQIAASIQVKLDLEVEGFAVQWIERNGMYVLRAEKE